MPAGTGEERGLRQGDRSVAGGGPEGGPASKAAEPRPVPPTRSWQLTAQDVDMMTSFRRDYLSLLEDRVATIRSHVVGSRVEPARVALLSLESSSAMVGADELVLTVRQLRAALSGGGGDGLEPLLQELDRQAAVVRARLEAATG